MIAHMRIEKAMSIWTIDHYKVDKKGKIGTAVRKDEMHH
jgi:hypothetical protein